MTDEHSWADATSEQIVADLQALIRIDTNNPPGNEIVAANWLADQLREVGLKPTVLESEPTRGSGVTRLEGTGEQEPLPFEVLVGSLHCDDAYPLLLG